MNNLEELREHCEEMMAISPLRYAYIPASSIITLIERIEKAETALSAASEKLKGDQVPIFLKQTGIGVNSCQGSYKEYVTIEESEYEENPTKHLKLFTAPQKPVVLPLRHVGFDGVSTNAGDSVRNKAISDCAKAIRVAGFTVEGE
ncbi:hypothetical protein ACE5I6_16445 [Yersinia ruckeri]|uniref:hypothetical protein n=1 Tax=Yersinia ruckeri TaxID=29486 RepID=UPI003D0E8E3F